MLELALNDGVDPLSAKRIRPATGDAAELGAFEDVLGGVRVRFVEEVNR